MTTISEIAAEAGVGVGTVSRYLNHRPSVSVAKKKQIQAAIENWITPRMPLRVSYARRALIRLVYWYQESLTPSLHSYLMHWNGS